MNPRREIRELDRLSAATMTPRAIRLFNAICRTQPTKPAVGVCLEGDTTLRLMATVALYRAGRIYRVIVTGGVDEPEFDRLPAAVMKQRLLTMGLPEEIIGLEVRSQNTREHALLANALARKQGYTELIIITSGYHLLRAYLTFLKDVFVQDHPFSLYGYPAGSLKTWFQKSPTEGPYRFLNFFSELAKLRKYKSDVASFEESWQYIQSLNAGQRKKQLARSSPPIHDTQTDFGRGGEP